LCRQQVVAQAGGWHCCVGFARVSEGEPQSPTATIMCLPHLPPQMPGQVRCMLRALDGSQSRKQRRDLAWGTSCCVPFSKDKRPKQRKIYNVIDNKGMPPCTLQSSWFG
jgi:hypothetical protein